MCVSHHYIDPENVKELGMCILKNFRDLVLDWALIFVFLVYVISSILILWRIQITYKWLKEQKVTI